MINKISTMLKDKDDKARKGQPVAAGSWWPKYSTPVLFDLPGKHQSFHLRTKHPKLVENQILANENIFDLLIASTI